MKNGDSYWGRYKIQETLYIGQCHLSPLQSRHLGTSQSSLNCHQLPCHIFLNLINGLNLFPFKGDFSLGKARSQRAPNLGCRGAESLGWFHVSPKNSAWDVMHEQACCHNEAANHQLPIIVSVFIILPLSTNEEHWGSTPFSLFGLHGGVLITDNTFHIKKKHS